MPQSLSFQLNIAAVAVAAGGAALVWIVVVIVGAGALFTKSIRSGFTQPNSDCSITMVPSL